MRRQEIGAGRRHHDLVAWQKAVSLVTDIYSISNSFPANEQFGLTQQMRRAAVSVASNIAEGSARNTGKELLHFLYMARGSLSEVETQLIIAQNLGYKVEASIFDKITTVFKLLGGLIRSKR